MKISKLGEFRLIDRISRKAASKDILRGIGDDAAVIRIGGKFIAITTDTMVENDHFSLKYFKPEQVGMKAIEINASDIYAMGGKPMYALVSLVLRKDTSVEFVDKLYDGMRKSCRKHGIEIVGGNMTHGREIVIDIDMIGGVERENIKLRSAAKPGDFIFVSGDLGKSRAGLQMFSNKINGHGVVKKAHLEPKANFKKVRPFLRYINAMIDVSDGLASEVTRICEQSKVGAIIFRDNVPVDDCTRQAAHVLGEDAVNYALFGGEDFELVYTVSEKNLNKVKGFLVGQITKKKGVRIYCRGKEKLLNKSGYDHFKV